MRPPLRKVVTYNRIYIGNGKHEKKETGEAYFHMWGYNYEEFENGAGNFSTAIIEREDGTIEELSPQEIKFID